MKEIIQNLALILIPSLSTWLLTKRKNKAEIRTAEIKAEVTAAEFYRGLLDDAMKRLNVAITTIGIQDQKINSLNSHVEYLKGELKKHKQHNEKTT